MKAPQGSSAIVSVGDELLAGRVVDTNAAWASAELRREGFPVVWRATVPDDADAIGAAIREARGRATLVIVGGGIGPTRDDVTREGMARGLGAPLAPHPAAADLVRACYATRGIRLPAGSDVQALLPAGTEPIPNPTGTAPGILHRDPGTGALIAALPGVPGEFRSMIEETLVPLLRSHPARGPAPAFESLTIAGLREIDIGRAVADLMERGHDPVVGSYPKLGRVVLTVESSASAPEEARRRVEEAAREIARRLGDAVAGMGDVRLNEVVARILLDRGTTVAVAESLTGGMIADGLVEVPGISKVFLAAFVTYSDQAKRDVLGVPGAVLGAHGAVSEACVRAMAEGARARTGAAFALSVSGIAGPSGGTAEKPVGTVWFGLSDDAGTVAERIVFPGDRSSVRAFSRERAYDFMRRRLLGLPLRPAPPAAS